MKLLSWDQQPGLASPRPYAANQNVKTQTPSKNETGAGCKSPHPGLRGGSQQRHIEVAQWTHPTAGSDSGSLEDLFHLNGCDSDSDPESAAVFSHVAVVRGQSGIAHCRC